ncbi:MAG TPA: hypothetical protein VKB38_12320 [Terracidiphilus sp.]|nr:hypothetical protein [Terracidiphilus sp.]
MSSVRWLSRAGLFALAGAAVLLAGAAANAQSSSHLSTSHESAASPAESSSTAYTLVTDSGDVAEPSAPAPAPAAGGQYDNKSSAGSSGWKSRLAFLAGAGFNIPESDTSNYLDTGFNLDLGGGMHFTHAITMLIKYQFIHDGLPQKLVAQTGANDGYAHIWSFTAEPSVDLFPRSANGIYVAGGGGFYRKVTSFTNPQPQQFCTYFYCGIGYTNVTVGHLSSNQGGWNIGGGFRHRFAGMYGDGKMEVFADARYLDIMTPAYSDSPNGLGVATIAAGTKLIPITFGVKF